MLPQKFQLHVPLTLTLQPLLLPLLFLLLLLLPFPLSSLLVFLFMLLFLGGLLGRFVRLILSGCIFAGFGELVGNDVLVVCFGGVR